MYRKPERRRKLLGSSAGVLDAIASTAKASEPTNCPDESEGPKSVLIDHPDVPKARDQLTEENDVFAEHVSECS